MRFDTNLLKDDTLSSPWKRKTNQGGHGQPSKNEDIPWIFIVICKCLTMCIVGTTTFPDTHGIVSNKVSISH